MLLHTGTSEYILVLPFCSSCMGPSGGRHRDRQSIGRGRGSRYWRCRGFWTSCQSARHLEDALVLDRCNDESVSRIRCGDVDVATKYMIFLWFCVQKINYYWSTWQCQMNTIYLSLRNPLVEGLIKLVALAADLIEKVWTQCGLWAWKIRLKIFHWFCAQKISNCWGTWQCQMNTIYLNLRNPLSWRSNQIGCIGSWSNRESLNSVWFMSLKDPIKTEFDAKMNKNTTQL